MVARHRNCLHKEPHVFRYCFILFFICVRLRPSRRSGGRSFQVGDSLCLRRRQRESSVDRDYFPLYRQDAVSISAPRSDAGASCDHRRRARPCPLEMRCWRYVKEALLAAGAVDSYPQTALARQAGDELVHRYGFKRLPVRDPYQAPIGSVLVYGSGRAAGHVEIRTARGFVSDFRASTPSRRPLIGVYAKTSS